MLKIDLTHADITKEFDQYQKQVSDVHQTIMEETCLGNDYLGWLQWPKNYDVAEFNRIKELAKEIREDADIFLVCGIGGSYLGARAVIEMVNGLYSDKKPEIIFIGQSVSTNYIHQVLNHIKGKSVYLNVISKSGTTTETAVAFRIFQQYLEATYGEEECKKRIIATTDKEKGTLNALAKAKGYEMFVIPDNIGGRFSVITAVGLLPIAVSGICVDALMEGLQQGYEDFNKADLNDNPAYQYALARYLLAKKGCKAEMFVTYESQLVMLAEWWKQLFGESEGKNGKGILPTSANFTTDLHSLGQFVQEGNKVLFETVITIDNQLVEIEFPHDEANLDNMNYLAGKKLSFVNEMARLGTLKAHEEEGNVPNLIIHLNDMSAKTFGYACYFFFKACAMSVLLQGENPFNQPGVEVYKKNMFELLGKK